jgi:small subunit ribosomal protein S20
MKDSRFNHLFDAGGQAREKGEWTILVNCRSGFGSSGFQSYFCRPKIVEFMANHKATKKDVRQAEKRRDRNKYYGKTTRNAVRELRAVKEQKEAGKQLPEVASMIDKLAKKGIIHKNKAANLKSKLARKVNSLAPVAKTAAAKGK